MDYYEGVVVEYLRADRAVFVNTEYCIQVNPGDDPDTSGPHWYCDAVALNFRSKEILLCEVSYATQLADLTKRLKGWYDNWEGVRHALVRDSLIPASWTVRPWLFVPKSHVNLLMQRLAQIPGGQPPKFDSKITELELVQPWLYRHYDRKDEKATQEGAV